MAVVSEVSLPYLHFVRQVNSEIVKAQGERYSAIGFADDIRSLSPFPKSSRLSAEAVVMDVEINCITNKNSNFSQYFSL